MTLNNIIDNILLIARNSGVSESEHLSRYQIELWVKSYRAVLIRLDIDKGRLINEAYLTEITPIHLDTVQLTGGNVVLVGDKELPKLISFHNKPGLIKVKDLYGNLIQIGSETKAKYQRSRLATCADYIAYLKGNKLYVNGGDNKLEYISASVIAEDPTDLAACYNPDSDFPVPAHMIPVITDMIMLKELRYMANTDTDKTNDTDDDTLK